MIPFLRQRLAWGVLVAPVVAAGLLLSAIAVLLLHRVFPNNSTLNTDRHQSKAADTCLVLTDVEAWQELCLWNPMVRPEVSGVRASSCM